MDINLDEFASKQGVFVSIEKKLRERAAKGLLSTAEYVQLANCKRMTGALEAASAIYNKAEVQEYLSFNGDGYEIPKIAIREEIIANNLIEETIDHILRNRNNLTRCGLGTKDGVGKVFNDEVRSNWELPVEELPIGSALKEYLTKDSSDLFSVFDLDALDLDCVEMKMRINRDGSHFSTHHDARRGRRLSGVFFFHSVPKSFMGGDLIIYDSDRRTEKCSHIFSRVTPDNNKLVIFPSGFFHAALPTQVFRQGLINSRFSVTFHIH